MAEVVVKGHAHSFNTHWYKKVEGVWKFAGLNPEIRWSEYDFDKVFAAGRDELGEETAEKAAGESMSLCPVSKEGVFNANVVFSQVSQSQSRHAVHDCTVSSEVVGKIEHEVDEQRDSNISVEPVINSCDQTIKASTACHPSLFAAIEDPFSAT